MTRYRVHWGPFLGQSDDVQTVCEGNVCRIVPKTPADVVFPPQYTAPNVTPTPLPTPAPAAPASGISTGWLVVGGVAALGVGLLVFGR